MSETFNDTTTNTVTAQQDPVVAAAAAPAAKAAEAKEKPKHKVLYIDRFRMTTPLNPGAENVIMSSFILGMYRGNPRLIVRTNDPQDQDNNYGRLVAPMDPATFQVFLAYIEKACVATEKVTFAIVNLTGWKNGQKLDQPQVLNTTVVGRSEDGRIWFTIQEGNRPTPRFIFGPPIYHVPSNPDRSPVPIAEASPLYARAMMQAMDKVVNAVAARFVMGEEEEDTTSSAEALDVKPAGDAGARQQGGWNRGGGNGGGGGGGGWNRGGQGGGGGGWNRGGGNGGGGGWNRGGQGGGGGGWNRGGGQGGGGGGNWNRGGGNGGGGYGGGQGGGGGGGAPAVNLADADIPM